MRVSRRRLLGIGGAMCLARVRAWPHGPEPVFTEVPAAKSGITWVHENGRSPEHWLPESMCSGCAFFDYDNDGWLDIFLVNTGASPFFHPARPPRNALYRNNRDGTFTDVTARAGLDSGRWGEGVAVGDFDADGYPDLYLTCYGKNILYRNNGDGTFTDVTEQAGVAGGGWSTSAAWFDYDNDGRLDLFVGNFVDYESPVRVTCGDNRLGKRFYCIPRVFEGRRSLLFHNNGDGTFSEAGALSDIGRRLGKAHGVVATDVNNDGLLDLWVSNDTVPNYLYLNRGGGKFEEIALEAGVAYGDNGQARSGMGVDSSDYDNDGKLDLFVANIDRERFALYRNDGGNTFTDEADGSGIGRATYYLSGWGLKFFDYDNDGNQDLFLSNGHPDDMVETYSPKVTWAEPLVLFHNDGARWSDVSAAAGPALQKRWPARGLATGDFDNDGGVDVLINNNGAAPLLLHNEAGGRNNWLGVKLIGVRANIDAVGAWIRWGFEGRTRAVMKTGGGSYLSAHDPRVVLGIGKAKKIDFLEIRWPLPSGRVERFTSLPLNRYVTITEGKGIAG
ncbi:MAG TPA: CRTAC1 family protein [Bryobacteraceae bacterium]|nr:CRTAC1 family protein [Bryobacteraceae bacterium]